MKPKLKIVQVFGTDGSGLYINGKLVCGWFTVGHARILEAIVKKWESKRLDQKWYNTIIHLPDNLKDCRFHKE